MQDASTWAPGFWDTVSDHVTAKVRPVLDQYGASRAAVVTYLQDLEAVARRECDRRDTIQIIASGRHLLGDRSEIEPADGPFSRT